MSDEWERQLREVQAYFRLPSIGLVEKDREVVRAIAAVAALDVSPFKTVFGGGTALARAHKIVRRMSEDVDFKIFPNAKVSMSRSALRHALAKLRGQVREALQDAGFASRRFACLQLGTVLLWHSVNTSIAKWRFYIRRMQAHLDDQVC